MGQNLGMERRDFFRNIAGHSLASLSDVHVFNRQVNGITFNLTVQKDAPQLPPVLTYPKGLNLPPLPPLTTIAAEEAQNWQAAWQMLVKEKFAENQKVLIATQVQNWPEEVDKIVWMGESLPHPAPQKPTLIVVKATDQTTADLSPLLAQLPEGSDVFAVLAGAPWPSPLLARIKLFCEEA